MNPRRRILWLITAVAVAAAVAILPSGWAAAIAGLAVLFVSRAASAADAAQALEQAPVAPSERVRSPAEHQQITALLDLFSEGVLLLDAENTVIAANTAAADVLGRPRSTMTGVSLIRAARDHVFLEVLRESAAEPREVELGEQRVIFATATPVASDEIRTVLTLQDMTALRRAERARRELVANVSHELRTPIAAALALAETLESGVDDLAQRTRFSQQLASELERLGRMVDRLLRLSRIESHTEAFHFEPVAVHELLSEAERHIAPVARQRNLRFEIDVPAEVPPVRADPDRALEVLSNVLENAVRHSPEGGVVTLRARVESDLVRIDVRDQGPGVLPQDRLRIFERFYTGESSRGEGLGTGLGLAIARHIVSRHGGEIWVGDEAPGATLSFTLPQASGAGTRSEEARERVP